MNKLLSVIRMSVLFILFSVAVVFLFTEEQDESLFSFTIHLIMDKAFAFVLFYYVGRLYKRWSKVDPWLKAYDRMCNDATDNPTPLNSKSHYASDSTNTIRRQACDL